MPVKRRAWGAKRRLAQARIIRRIRPWTRSTGPRTAAGKAAVALNAFKTGSHRAESRALHALLCRQGRYRRLVEEAHKTGFCPVGLHAEGTDIIIQLRRVLNAVNLWP